MRAPVLPRLVVPAFLLAVAISSRATAQTGLPTLLRDIATPPAKPWTRPSSFGQWAPVALRGELYFVAWHPTEGSELRATDGTAAGTRTVRDICPGSCSGALSSPWLVESGGTLYFVANDGVHGGELWRSDGTRAGTRMVAEVEPGDDIVDPRYLTTAPRYLTAAPGGVYFVGTDRVHGSELWWSDGTAAGTHLVVDLRPGDLGASPGYSTWLPGVGLFFDADDGVHGREPWMTQGTAATTFLLADIAPGPAASILPEGFVRPAPAVAGAKVFFLADDGEHGPEPWVTDGTPTGTHLVADLVPGPDGSWAQSFFPFGADVLFAAGTLWRSDGTAAGTTALGDAAHGTEYLDPRTFCELGGVVYFVGFQPGLGRELWRTDGTLAGTQLVVEVRPGPESGLTASYTLTAAAGRLWFPGYDTAHGIEWWQSDGTAGGTFMVDDFAPGSDSSLDFYNSDRPAAVDASVLLSARDDINSIHTVRTATPGVAGSTVVFSTRQRPGSARVCYSEICPIVMTAVGEDVVFAATDAVHGTEPWRTDGTETGTRLVADFAPGGASSVFVTWPYTSQRSFAALGDDLLVNASECDVPCDNQPDAYQLRRADRAGNVTQVTSEPWEYPPHVVAAWKGAVYFDTQADGLWQSDGTPPGTRQLAAGHYYVAWFTAGEENLYFVNLVNPRLWKTDGTSGGTKPLADALAYVVDFEPVQTVDAGGHDRLYFVAHDAAAGRELWTSDGSDGGTRRVVDLRPGSASGVPAYTGAGFVVPSLVAVLGSKVVFTGDDGGAGEELWVSDGSPGNATLLEIRPGAAGSQPRYVTAAGGRVYFVADDGVHGREPWVTDGTPAGTHLVRDVRPGPESSTPQELVDWMGRLVFAADDDVHGMELWRADEDGTDAKLVVDLRPGVAPSSPQGVTAVGEKLYLFADDGTTGLEPWVWSAAADLFADGFEGGSIARWSRATPP